MSVVDISEEEIKAVVSVLKSGHIVQGPTVAALEKKITKLTESKYAVAVSNGTAALHTALFSLGIKDGDEVITTPFSFIATANAIRMVGAIPVFVDIDEKTFNIDVNLIENKITAKTKAIITVDLYGLPADYREIKKIASKHNLFIIEDAAQSINSEYRGIKAGNIVDITCFSFYATKNIMCGEGGVITTNNKKYYMYSRLFRQHGQSNHQQYDYKSIGYNYRMTDILAAIALTQMKNIDYITQKRQSNAHLYNRLLNEVPGIITPEIPNYSTHVFHQYSIRITSKFPLSRDQLKEYLLKNGIDSKVYYPKPLFNFKHLRLDKNFDYNDFPITRKVCNEVLSLPIHPNLSRKNIEYISDKIKCL